MPVRWHSSVTPDVRAVVENYYRCAERVLSLPSQAHFTTAKLASGWGATILGGRWNGVVQLSNILTPHETALILSHELIHLHQIHTGRLGGTPSGGVLWHGVLWHGGNNLSYLEYQQLPWEVEAFRQQEWLLDQVLRISQQNVENG